MSTFRELLERAEERLLVSEGDSRYENANIELALEIRAALDSETSDPLYDALYELDRIHARLIAAVTPGHAGWVKYPSEEYDALFSGWHSATRKCRALLGPNTHAEPNARVDGQAVKP